MTEGRRARATRYLDADADAVFEVLTDLDNLSAWLPAGIEAERYCPGVLRLWISRHHVDHVVERRLQIDWTRLRVAWGEPGSTYSGAVRVQHEARGRCAVNAHVTGPVGAHRTMVAAWLGLALDGLAAAASSEEYRVPWWTGTVLT